MSSNKRTLVLPSMSLGIAVPNTSRRHHKSRMLLGHGFQFPVASDVFPYISACCLPTRTEWRSIASSIKYINIK